jgi:nitric oxide reductase subunit B
LAALLFCARYLMAPQAWSDRLVRVAFWSLNGGLALMVGLDLFPAGVLQLWAVLEHGLWYGRSLAFVQGTSFQTLTWLRAVGGPIFVVGGLLPLAWFTLSRYRMLKPACGALMEPVPAAPEPADEEFIPQK